MSNVPELFKSKRFWVSLTGLIVIIVSAFEPHLAARFEEIAPSVLIIVGALVGGYTITDTAEARASSK